MLRRDGKLRAFLVGFFLFLHALKKLFHSFPSLHTKILTWIYPEIYSSKCLLPLSDNHEVIMFDKKHSKVMRADAASLAAFLKHMTALDSPLWNSCYRNQINPSLFNFFSYNWTLSLLKCEPSELESCCDLSCLVWIPTLGANANSNLTWLYPSFQLGYICSLVSHCCVPIYVWWYDILFNWNLYKV